MQMWPGILKILINFRFNKDEGAYFFDILSPLFEKTFVQEAVDDFVAFQSFNENKVISFNQGKRLRQRKRWYIK